ncbi:hypothetical protein E4U57_006987 [Claviceps arundinis]|uniref:Uncharacterized protein n=1 Tax=Claviceps arundinis TaxID=1623583 RepID=A0ABQ7PFX7_9HYPO|nr:hypothetical protein E4U57_006987 [Claviceps arundinis]
MVGGPIGSACFFLKEFIRAFDIIKGIYAESLGWRGFGILVFIQSGLMTWTAITWFGVRSFQNWPTRWTNSPPAFAETTYAVGNVPYTIKLGPTEFKHASELIEEKVLAPTGQRPEALETRRRLNVIWGGGTANDRRDRRRGTIVTRFRAAIPWSRWSSPVLGRSLARLGENLFLDKLTGMLELRGTKLDGLRNVSHGVVQMLAQESLGHGVGSSTLPGEIQTFWVRIYSPLSLQMLKIGGGRGLDLASTWTAGRRSASSEKLSYVMPAVLNAQPDVRLLDDRPLDVTTCNYDGTSIAASPTLQQSGPILPAQCGLDPDDVFGPTSAQSREFFAPSARSGQYRSTTVSDESEVETDIITLSARSSQYRSATVSGESEVETDIITPSARSSQYRSATVSDESEVETDIITPSAPSAHPSQYRSVTVSDESVESSDAPDTPRASVNHTGLPLDVAERYWLEWAESVMISVSTFGSSETVGE